MIGSFPARLRAEGRTRLLQPPVQGGQTPRSARHVRIERIAKPVVVGVGLARQPGGEAWVTVDVAEPPRPVRPDVDARVAGRDPARHRATDPAAATEAVERQTGRHPEPAHAGEWSEKWIRIRRHRVRVADESDRLRVCEEREAPDGTGHQGGESLVVGRHRARRVLPRDAVLPARDRVRLVPTEDHAAVFALAVHEVVGVAEARHVPRELGAGYRLERDVLVIDRRGRDERPDHRRHLRRPDAGRVDDDLRGDGAVLGDDVRDLARRGELEPGHANTGPDPDTQRAGGVRDGMRGAVRVQVAVTGEMDRAVQRLGRDGRHEPARLVRSDDAGIEADPASAAGRPLELAELVRTRRESQAPDPLERTEALVQLDAVSAERHHRGRRIERGHEARRLAGGAGRELGLFDEQDVRPSGQREVVRDAAAGDPPADHHDPGLVRRHQWQFPLPVSRVSPAVVRNVHSYEERCRTSRRRP